MMTDSTNNYCVILAGGVGSRLWPRSSVRRPKQFVDFLGTGRTLLQMTFDRCLKIVPLERVLVVTNLLYGDLVREQLPDLPVENILKEPTYRNTVPALAWAAYHLRALNPEACMAVVPCDQYILKEDEFAAAIRRGLAYVAGVERLLTVGIHPTRPETRYGYIQVDEAREEGIYQVKSFTEKPEYDFARFFVESGEFYWNSGVFMWHVNTILKVMEGLVPDIKAVVRTVDQLDTHSFLASEEMFVRTFYPICPNLSIEYGVLERSDNVDVLTGDFGWSDVGGWDTLYELAPKDEAGNVVLGTKTLLCDCRDNLVMVPGKRAVVLKDLEGYMVLEDNGVLMVCKRDDMAAVRRFRNDVETKM